MAAVAILEVISRALPGFFNTLFANFLPALAEILPEFLKKLPTPSASIIVLSLTIIGFFLLQIELYITNNLFSLTVFFIKRYLTNNVFCTRIVFLTSAITISFKLLKAHLKYQILVLCNVKVNVSPLKLTSSLFSSSK